jgi:alginate O-acetyltransferase complex protein AlgI
MEFFCALIGLLVIVKNNTLRQYILLGASYIFYGAWSVNYLALIAACSFWGWWLGLLMSRTHSQKTKKLYLIISLVLSLGMLGYFKYANFFAENIINAFGLEWRHLDILLPVGISFFTFQTMSYTIDLYRGNIGVCKSAPKFFLFVAFFPQLVAGPIVRASEFLPQLDKKITFTKKNFLLGAQLFLGGALQKALVADNLSVFVDPVFSSPELYSPLTLWLALIGYSLQIFCDFSGYSLMAIGIAKILGFQLPVNFRMPYVSLSITEFWRRWHISLSFWLRDYLYISLGGNRHGEIRTRINLMLTMFLGGLWHGASWNFVLWGALHGIALIIHKYWSVIRVPIKQTAFYSIFSWGLTYFYVLLAWLPFRSPDFTATTLYLRKMFDFSADGIMWIDSTSVTVIFAVLIWHWIYKFNNVWYKTFPIANPMKTAYLYPLLISLFTILLFAPVNASPFVYFQF